MRRKLREQLVDGARELGVILDDEAVDRFSTYLALLREWGGVMNLTSRLGEGEVLTHHFLDSLSGAFLIDPAAGGRLIDLGSGAGFPGLPLKIAFPELEVVLVDSVRKKVAFCRQVIRRTRLAGIRAEVGRAEALPNDPSFSGGFGWAAARAVDRAARIVEVSLPFLGPAGAALIYKGRPDALELKEFEGACRTLGLGSESHAVRVPGIEASRTILVARRLPS